MSIMCLPEAVISRIGYFCGAYEKSICIRAHPLFNSVSALDNTDSWYFIASRFRQDVKTLDLRQGFRLQKKYKPNIKHLDIHFTTCNVLCDDDISVLDESLIVSQQYDTLEIHVFNNPVIIRQLFTILQRRKDLKKLPTLVIFDDLSVVVDLMEEFPDVRISQFSASAWTFMTIDNKPDYIRRLSSLHDRIDLLVFQAECVTWPLLDMSPLVTFKRVKVQMDSVILHQGGVVDLLAIATEIDDRRKWLENGTTNRITGALAKNNKRLSCITLRDVDFTSIIASKWCYILNDLGILLNKTQTTQLVLTGGCLSNPAIVPFIRLLKEIAPTSNICIQVYSREHIAYGTLIKYRLAKDSISVRVMGDPTFWNQTGMKEVAQLHSCSDVNVLAAGAARVLEELWNSHRAMALLWESA